MTGKQLRNSILQWAIQGKLVPQDPNDEPASVLLERIREEKARLVKEKKIKKDKNESIIYRGEDNSYYEKFLATGEVKCIDEEIPFDIPQGWEWVRLGTYVEVKGGKRIPVGTKLTTIDTGQIYIRVSDMKEYSVVDTDIHYVPHEIQPIIKAYTISSDDIYITVAGTIGRVGLIPKQFDGANLTENANKLSLYEGDKTCMMYLLDSPYIQQQIAEITTKVGQPKLAIIRIQNLLIPVCPINEQKRITEKINHLLPFIHIYEKEVSNFEHLNNQLYDQLHKSILQEAIQGRLVPQIESEGTAEELLEEIRAEKKRLVKEGKLKKSAIANESSIFRGDDNKYYEQIGSKSNNISELIPFEIPSSWRWARLSNVILLLSGRDLDPEQYNSSGKGIPYITGASNFNNGSIIINRWTESPITVSQLDDLLITCKGTIGEMAFNKIGDLHIARQVMALKVFINADYLKAFLEIKISELNQKAKSMIPGISRHDLLDMVIPIPPFREQLRITEMLTSLLSHF